MARLSPNEQPLQETLLEMYTKIIQQYQAVLHRHPLEQDKYSRDNLLAYLVLQKEDIRKVQQSLTEKGLASLNHSHPHVLFTLEKILENIGVTMPHNKEINSPTPLQSMSIVRNRSEKLFGPKANDCQSNIMVTLDAKMIDQPHLLEELLLNGMNVARINCAHDDETVWERLIDCLRLSEKRLKEKGEYQNKCKVYMDLAGPKVRIGKLQTEKEPLKISVPKGSTKENDHKIIGFLDAYALQSKLLDQEKSFVFAVKRDFLMKIMKVDGKISFQDVQNRDRTLRIIEIISDTCVKVELNKTALIDEETIFYYKNKSFSIHGIDKKPIDIHVVKNDVLRLYLDSTKSGHPASIHGPAGVPVTLEKAFRNVQIKDRIFIDDGKIQGIVQNITDSYVELKIVFPSVEHARIKEGKGLNMPDSLLSLNLPALTEKDFHDLKFVAKHADIVGISFVHSPLDLVKLRYELERLSSLNLAVVAKIETKDAIHHLSRIILEGLKFHSFGIMIARGDLAVEVGPEYLAYVQDDILDICSAAHIPVIWATGVLEKLTKKGIPSRSEITDASYGVRADCIMLNKGPYIIDSVKMLSKLLKQENVDPFRSRTSRGNLTMQYGFFNQKR